MFVEAKNPDTLAEEKMLKARNTKTLKKFSTLEQLCNMNDLVVCVIGVGGNSSIVSLLLSHHNVREIRLVDGDTIEKNNIERQILFKNTDIGKNKAETMVRFLKNQECETNLLAFPEYLDSINFRDIIDGCNLMIDCTDSMFTRMLINEISVMMNIPWIMTSSLDKSLELKLIIPGKTACLNCLTEGKKLVPINCSYDNVEFYVPSLASVLAVSIAVNFYEHSFVEDCVYYMDAGEYEFHKVKTSIRDTCNVCIKRDFPIIKEKRITGRAIY
ncbi:MAG: HesA/MoeB/ThiF family protein [Thermoplasmataceae archaeon]